MLRNTYSKSRVTKLCLYADNEITIQANQYKLRESTKASIYKLHRDFGGWFS